MERTNTKNLTFDFLSADDLPKSSPVKFKKVWAVGGGKGGTGKTLMSVNIAVKLAGMGKRTLLIDADLGGANLHTCLGLTNPKKTLGDFISKSNQNLEDVIVDTRIENLSLINGSGDMLDVANLKHTQKMRFIRQFKQLDVDNIILDLGAGTNFNILDFFTTADMGIVVLMPEPTSIENSYRFLKAVFYRKLKGSVPVPMIKRMIDDIVSKKDQNLAKTPFELLQKIEEIDKITFRKLSNMINDFKIKLVVNQIKNQRDFEIGNAMAKACKRYFGIETEFLGGIHHDPLVWTSIQKRVPISVMSPDSKTSVEFDVLVNKLLDVK